MDTKAWRLYREGRSMELVDTTIFESCYMSQILRSIQVGLLCVQQNPDDRPTMSSVVLMLGSEGTLPLPKQPGFFTERNPENESVVILHPARTTQESQLMTSPSL
ncbi:unnamed protein product [Thlaspi arvense]|uniref:S-locus receptor kinase C-terminal domain-containing protein n=1 Tax=Thlaspi arvense TaxID=13288 RepID=A0AAU9S2S3_THLAR|nr:unnamed protein product [Thlaspi arvense]